MLIFIKHPEPSSPSACVCLRGDEETIICIKYQPVLLEQLTMTPHLILMEIENQILIIQKM